MKFSNQDIGLLIFYGVGFLMVIAVGITLLLGKKAKSK